MIDLSHRIVQPATLTKAPNGHVKWHPYRRLLQVLCGVLLVALPLTNGLRLDVRRDEFYFAWHRMAAHDLYLLFWVAMLGVWGLVAVSFLYGRLWCGWVCPQTLASDFADSVKRRLDKAFQARPGSSAFFAARTVWTLVMLAISAATGILLATYWLAPRTVAFAASHPLADLPASLTIYGIAAVLAVDLLWVRRKFCSEACPYGALMSLLADKNTLAVRYLEERTDDCIKCGKCVTDCPMGIDIKQGVGQLSCIGCGECVDACNDVLGKRGKAGLIEFRYGLEPEHKTHNLTWKQRWGLWDSRRAAVVATLFVILGIVFWLIYGSTPLAANVIANGAITRDAAAVSNTYALTIANGAPRSERYAVMVTGLPQGRITVPASPVTVAAHDERMIAVTVVGPTSLLKPKRRTTIHLWVRGSGERTAVQTIFYTPAP